MLLQNRSQERRRGWGAPCPCNSWCHQGTLYLCVALWKLYPEYQTHPHGLDHIPITFGCQQNTAVTLSLQKKKRAKVKQTTPLMSRFNRRKYLSEIHPLRKADRNHQAHRTTSDSPTNIKNYITWLLMWVTITLNVCSDLDFSKVTMEVKSI
jgi:hypothetical protein